MIVIGTKNGETRLDFPMAIFSVSLSIVIKPPIPDPTYTPNLLLLIFSTSNPDDFIASSAAYNTNCENLSNLLTSFFGITSSGWKSLTSAPIFTSIVDVSMFFI